MVLIKPPTRPYQSLSTTSGGPTIRKCWTFFVLAICLYAAGRSQNHPEGLRGAAKDLVANASSAVGTDKAVVDTTNASIDKDTVIKEEDKEESAVSNEEAKEEPAKPQQEETAPGPVPAAPAPQPGAVTKLCERNIGIDLSDHTKWPTPYTPSYFDKEPESDDAVLLLGQPTFGNTLIIGIFHGIDLAYDKKCQVYITKDCNWIWDYVSKWFYGDKAKDDAFWKSMEDIFGVHVIADSSAESIQQTGKNVHRVGSEAGYRVRSEKLTAEQMRNRRDTIFRQLFKDLPAQCGNINAAGVNKVDAKYTVIDVPVQDAWNDKVKEYTKHDHTANFEMKPEYVKSILEPLGMADQPIYLQNTVNPSFDPDREEVKRLVDDASLKTQDKDVSNDLYMAVLADCFIGYPASHWSMMVARIRYALGVKNTFVLTEEKDGKWVSYVDEKNYLDLYDINSPWLG